jgi:hypothetical protein
MHTQAVVTRERARAFHRFPRAMHLIIPVMLVAMIPWVYAIWLVRAHYRAVSHELRERERQNTYPTHNRPPAAADPAGAPSLGGFG